MKVPLFSIVLALCLAGLGCEMHPVPRKADNHGGKEPQASSELHKALEPEKANPAPPSFFPTSKPE